ncbi:helix-turn-helix domain-containing protein [Roseomonas xinghualingensis]|uniref:helix-turn-helix domain-containing protein n=1 Tax=Roseomonas xinghualingensis TaxID=2986475 RepID=UPI0021F145E4|nr:helix-turn-helix domain-containing protein [Roseomonas sp. SXEYE001]MCV4206014.1 helix-turn-helix domain-containing protein [Roseomonas sp. SXEYE001]
MTPFGARLRRWRVERGVTLREMAAAMQVSAAYLSALEHGRRGAPSVGLVHQVCEYLGLIWDDADELTRLAQLSRPKVVLDTSGLPPEATELANRLADSIRSLPPGVVNELMAVLERGARGGGK